MNLLTESLWGDEGFSAMAVQRPFLEMIGVVMRDTAPPFFYVLGFIWGRIFGFSEISLRSLSCLLMLGASFFAGKIIYEVGRNKVAAILGGTMAFLTPFLIGFAFEWRMYATLAFLVMGSIYFFVARKWTGFVIFSALSLYAHHFALFTLAGQVIYFLFFIFEWKGFKIKRFLKETRPFWLVGLLYLPWVYPMYLQVTRVQGGGFWLSMPKIKEIFNLMYRFITGEVDERHRLGVAIVVAGLLVGKKWKKVGKRWVELLIIFMAPVVLSVLVSYLVTPIFYDRYLLATVIGVAVLVVLGTRKWLLLLVGALVLFYGWTSGRRFLSPSKRPFRELAGYVKEQLRDNDYLVNYNGKAHHLWESKYYGLDAPIYTPDGPLPLYVGTAQMTEKDTVDNLPEVEGRIGVIASEPLSEIQIRGHFEEYDMETLKSFENDRLLVIWWRKR